MKKSFSPKRMKRPKDFSRQHALKKKRKPLPRPGGNGSQCDERFSQVKLSQNAANSARILVVQKKNTFFERSLFNLRFPNRSPRNGFCFKKREQAPCFFGRRG